MRMSVSTLESLTQGFKFYKNVGPILKLLFERMRLRIFGLLPVIFKNVKDREATLIP